MPVIKLSMNGRYYRIYKDLSKDFVLVEIKRFENPKLEPFCVNTMTTHNGLKANRAKTKAVLTTSIAIKEESIEYLYFMMKEMNGRIASESQGLTKC